MAKAKIPDTVAGPALLNLPVSLVSVWRTFPLGSNQEMLITAVEYSVIWITASSKFSRFCLIVTFVLSMEIGMIVDGRNNMKS